MDEKQLKAMLKETFDTVSGGYDSEALRFFQASAEHMPVLLGLQGNENVLDVACGTGNAALAIAKFLATGQVTAVDFSSGMLDQARRKAASLDVRNVEFIERDMQNLKFSDGLFDVAVCAFGIFFVEDMENQLSHIASAVKPGGRIMISNFQENYFHPLKDMFYERLEAYGVQMPPQTWKRIASEMGCMQLFEHAGLTNIIVTRKNVGYHLDSAQQWWDVVWNAGFRRMVSQLSTKDQERFKREHLDEVETLRTRDGIWLDVGVLFTSGKRGWIRK
ncbi:MAG: methyltransferase domain-containing protein [Candidatus Methanoperedens sp.]|nr:methyltransferase domain-containing protein [Candidatus Methanoperedens sp.]CAG1002362.1 Aklanonic acid methyltransferase DnrC [Methanosarcinales archaeon]